MQRHPRMIATFLVLASTVGCVRMCPPPQTLLSLGLDGKQCRSDRVMVDVPLRSSGLEFQLRREQGSLHVCVILQEAQ